MTGADRPGQYGRGQDLDTFPRGRLPMCILVETLDTLPLVDAGGEVHAAGLPIGRGADQDQGDGRGQALDTLPRGRVCRSVRTRTRATRPRTGPRHAPLVDAGGEVHAAGLSIGADQDQGDTAAGRISTRSHAAGVADVHPGRGPDSFPWSMPAGRFTRPGCRSVRTRARATRPRAGPRHAPTWPVADVHPGRGPRQLHLVDAGGVSPFGPFSIDQVDAPGRGPHAGETLGPGHPATAAATAAGRLTTAGLSIGADQDQGDTAAGRISTRSHAAGVADVHPGRGPDSFPWSMPAGRFTRPGCRSVRTRTRATRPRAGPRHAPTWPVADVHPGRGPRQLHLVDAGGVSPFGPFSIDQVDAPGRGPHAGETLGPGHPATAAATAAGRLTTAGLSIGADQDQGDTAAGRISTRSHAAGVADVHPGRGPDSFPWSMPAGRFTRPGCRSVRTRTRATRPRAGSPHAPTRPGLPTCILVEAPTASPGRCRRGGSRGRVVDRCGPGPGRHGRGQDLAHAPTRPGLPTCILVEAPTASPGRCRRGGSRGRVVDRCGPGPGRHGRGQDLDTLPRGRLPTCILVEALDSFTWSMPAAFLHSARSRSTRWTPLDVDPTPARRSARATRPRPRRRPPADSPRPGCRSVRTRTRATRPRAGSPHAPTRPGLPTCILVEAPTASPGRCRRGGSRGRVVDRCGPGPGRHGRGQDLDTLPRGRLPTCILVEALDSFTWSMPAAFLHSARSRSTRWTPLDVDPTPARRSARATRPRPRRRPPADSPRPGCRSVRTRTRATRPRAGSPHAPTRPGLPTCILVEAPTASPGRCRRGGSRGRVVDRCGPGPGRHGRGQDLHTLPRGRGCRRASWSRPRQLPLVDAGGEVHAAGLSIGADQDQGDTAAGRISTRSHAAGVADVHPGRGPRQLHLVDAGGVSPFGPFSIDQVDAPGRGPHAGETLGPGHPATAAVDGRRQTHHGRAVDRCGPGPGRHGRGQDLHTLPRGRGCRRASWSRPRQLPLVDAGGEVHAAGLSIGADQDQGDTAAGRISHTLPRGRGCRRASWSRPRQLPGRCRRGGSRGRVVDRCGPGPGRHGRGQDLDTLPRGRLPTCILVEALDSFTWSMPAAFLHSARSRSTRWTPLDVDPTPARRSARATRPRPRRRPPADSPRPGCRSVRTRTRATRPRAGSPHAPTRPGLPTCILVEAPTASPGRCRRGASRGRVADWCGPGPGRHGRGQDLDRLTTRPVADVHPGRGPRQLHLVDAGGELHAAGLPIGADQDQGDTAAGRTSTRSHVAGCRRASWSRPSTASPGRCRRGASRGRVADRCGPGPGRHGRGQDPDTLPRGRLPTCILVEALDTLPWSMPAGSFTWPGCRSVRTRTRATRPRAGPRHAPLVDAGGELHTAGWSIGRGSEQRPARQAHHVAGYRSAALQTGYQGDGREQDLDRLTTRPFADVHPGRGPRHAPLVDAGGELHAAGLSIGADQGPGDTAAGRTSTRSHVAGCRRASWSRPSTASPGRCRRRFSIRPVLDRPGGRPWTWTPRRRDARPFVHRGERDFRWVWTWTPRRRDARPGPPGHGRGDGQLINPADPSERIEAVAVFPEEDS